MTYTLDSDFPFLYGKFSPVVPHPGDDEELAKIIRDFGVSNTNLAASKKRGALAAQFVSHCRTASKRNAVVRSVTTILHFIDENLWSFGHGVKIVIRMTNNVSL